MHRFLVSKNWVPIHGDVQDLIGLPVLQSATHLQLGGDDLARKLTGCAAIELTMFPVTRLRNGRSLHKTATLTLHQSHQAPLTLHEAINKRKRTHFSDRYEHGKVPQCEHRHSVLRFLRATYQIGAPAFCLLCTGVIVRDTTSVPPST
jgi:hypothetical protein